MAFWTGVQLLPLQVGVPSEYARSRRRHMIILLSFQIFICLMSLIEFVDILGGIITLFALLFGFWGWQHDMNITYICLWGILCLAACITTAIQGAVPLLTHTAAFTFSKAFARGCVPFVLGMGAVQAWFFYEDYESDPNHFGKDLLAQFLVTLNVLKPPPIPEPKMFIPETGDLSRKFEAMAMAADGEAAAAQQGMGKFGSWGNLAHPHREQVAAARAQAGQYGAMAQGQAGQYGAMAQGQAGQYGAMAQNQAAMAQNQAAAARAQAGQYAQHGQAAGQAQIGQYGDMAQTRMAGAEAQFGQYEAAAGAGAAAGTAQFGQYEAAARAGAAGAGAQAGQYEAALQAERESARERFNPFSMRGHVGESVEPGSGQVSETWYNNQPGTNTPPQASEKRIDTDPFLTGK